jgi:hypothetical protein
MGCSRPEWGARRRAIVRFATDLPDATPASPCAFVFERVDARAARRLPIRQSVVKVLFFCVPPPVARAHGDAARA